MFNVELKNRFIAEFLKGFFWSILILIIFFVFLFLPLYKLGFIRFSWVEEVRGAVCPGATCGDWFYTGLKIDIFNYEHKTIRKKEHRYSGWPAPSDDPEYLRALERDKDIEKLHKLLGTTPPTPL